MRNRRSFLKLAGLGAFGLAVGGIPVPAVAQTYSTGSSALKGKRWAMAIDLRKLANPALLKDIAAACHREHNVPDVAPPQDIKWIWTDSFDHSFPDEMNEHLPEYVKQQPVPLLCNHCTNPPCVRVCPTQATFQRADGIVVMDYHRCIGCRFCMAGCPYGARSFNFHDPRPLVKDPNPAFPQRMKGVVEKCTFCSERLEAGKQPACVEASEGAILFGDLEDPASDVRRALASNYSIRRKSSLGTQPGVYYLI